MPRKFKTGHMPKSGPARREWLMPEGKPLYVQCFQTKRDPGADPYCIVFTQIRDGYVHLVTASANQGPQGVYLHDSIPVHQYHQRGSRIRFDELPKAVQARVIEEYEDYWGLSDHQPVPKEDFARRMEAYAI